jgi:hypothetical protein
MVNSWAKVDFWVDLLDLYHSKLIALGDKFIVVLSTLLSKLTLNHKGERAGNLVFESINFSNQGWAANGDPVEWPVSESGFESVLDDGLNVELEIEPDTF